MIYSGVDLIRRSEDMFPRAEKLTAVKAAEPAPAGDREPDQQGALLRFARFVNKEKKKKPVSKPGNHPYSTAFGAFQRNEERGQMIDIYI